MLGIVVACREGLHGVETTYTRLGNSSFGTTDNHDVGFTQTKQVEGVDQAVGRRGASAHGAIVGAVEAIVDRELTSCNIRDHLGDEERIVTRTNLGVIAHGLLMERLDASDARAVDDADAVLVLSLEVDATILDGLACCCKGKLRIAVDLTDFLLLEI